MKSFLTPLLSNKNFMSRTLVLLSMLPVSPKFLLGISLTCGEAFDETESYISNNQVFSVLFGDALSASKHGTEDNTAYTHYSQMATVEKNWGLGNLGLSDSMAAAFF